jgi:putative phosphoesterase
MKIGVISDTHNFLDPKVLTLFQGVDHILHGGDVGGGFITFQLEQIAPVTAVLGNTDSLLPLKETEVVELDGRKYLVHHIVNTPGKPDEPLRSQVLRERPDVVVFGHTHKPFCQKFGAILYFNPGYAGKPRFGMDRSVAILRWEDGDIRPEFLPL